MILAKLIDDKLIWENALLKFSEANFLQSWNWGQFQQNLGKKVFRIAFYKKNNLLGLVQLIKESAKRGPYFSVGGGPLLNWKNKLLLENFITTIRVFGKAEKVWFLRIRPQILDTPENRLLVKKLGFSPAPMHLHAQTTWQLNLEPSKDDLFDSMKKGHRYELKKAFKNNIKIILSRKISDVNLLYKLQLNTARRQKFVPFSQDFLQKQFEQFLKDDSTLIFKAVLNKKVIGMAMVIFFGKEAIYHYAASTQKGREVSAAYAICWSAILEAKKRGFKNFNFWGIAPKDKVNHRFARLNHFKKGFGGFGANYLPAHDFLISKYYYLTYSFELLRKLVRGL